MITRPTQLPDLDVRDYLVGANPVQSLIDALPSTGGVGRLVGARTLTTGVSFGSKTHVSLVGASDAILKHDAGASPLLLIPQAAFYSTIEKLLLTRPVGGTSTGHGILYQGVSGSSAFHYLEQVVVDGLGGDGVRMEQGNHVTAVRLYSVNNAGNGLTLATGSGQPSNVNVFVGSAFRVNAGKGVYVQNADDAYFYGVVVESNVGWGAVIDAGVVYVRFLGAHFENNGTGGGGAGHLSLDGSYCTFDSVYFSSGKPISITGDRNTFANCTMGDQVTIAGTADGTLFENCDFAVLPADSGTNTVYRNCTVNGAAMFSENKGAARFLGLPGNPNTLPANAAVAINPSAYNFTDGVSFWVGVGGVEQLSVNAQWGYLKAGKSIWSTAATTKTANYTATVADEVIVGNNSGGSITITLPAAATSTGKQYWIKRVNTQNVVVDANASETIDGALTKTLGTQYAAVHIRCDGVGWNILAQMGTVT